MKEVCDMNYKVNGQDYKVIGQVEMSNGNVVPLLDIPMMSDERWNELVQQQAIKYYIRENGEEPESLESVPEWYRDWCKIQGQLLENPAALPGTVRQH